MWRNYAEVKKFKNRDKRKRSRPHFEDIAHLNMFKKN